MPCQIKVSSELSPSGGRAVGSAAQPQGTQHSSWMGLKMAKLVAPTGPEDTRMETWPNLWVWLPQIFTRVIRRG